MLRSTGQYARAEQENTRALDLTIGTLGEPVSHAHLDLAELALRRGDLATAQQHVALTDERITDNDTMAWHQRQRVLLMRSRCALAADDLETATACAAQLELDAQWRGSRRYLVLARLQQATIAAAAGISLDHDAVDATVQELARVAGVDAWLLAADLAAHSGVERWWSRAETFAADIERAAVRDRRTDATVLRDHIAQQFQRRRR
jgi:hypothetical protein